MNHFDKFLGMIQLGVYGDILGAPIEKEALEDSYFTNPDTLGQLVHFNDLGRVKNCLPDKWAICLKDYLFKAKSYQHLIAH